MIDGHFQDEAVIVVLDAKDYAPALTERWPATESIGKQLLYRYLLSDRYKPGQLAFENIGNAFLMPARLPTDPNSSAPHGRRDAELRSAIIAMVMQAMHA